MNSTKDRNAIHGLTRAKTQPQRSGLFGPGPRDRARPQRAGPRTPFSPAAGAGQPGHAASRRGVPLCAARAEFPSFRRCLPPLSAPAAARHPSRQHPAGVLNRKEKTIPLRRFRFRCPRTRTWPTSRILRTSKILRSHIRKQTDDILVRTIRLAFCVEGENHGRFFKRLIPTDPKRSQ